MKKLLALLMACATMTFAFASCGNDEGSESESESSISESSEEETTEETTEEVTEEDTTEETTEEDTDAEEETTEGVEKPTFEFIEDADKTAFLGKWECEKLVVEGEEMTDLMGIPLYAVYQLEIKEDGTAIMGESLNELSDAEVSMIYEWGVISDNEIAVINDDGDSMVFTLEGEYMVGTEDGYDEQIYFVNVDDFTPFDFESFMGEFQEGLEDTEIYDSALTDSDSESEMSVIGDSEEELADPPTDSETEDSVAE